MTTSPTQPAESFPRQSARTRRFRLGMPRSFAAAPDGSRVAFLRSSSGVDPANALHVLDLATGAERLVVDPRALLAGGDEDVPAAERARRERMRETTSGITAYSLDAAATLAAFAVAGRLFVAPLDVGAGPARELPAAGPVVDPQLSPDGRLVAYVVDGAVHVGPASGGPARVVLAPESGTVTYGLVDFIAAEELGRSRGLWWAPSSDTLLVERVDEESVPRWWISDPAHPEAEPRPHRYPAAGQANPAVSLHLVDVAEGAGPAREVRWDHEAFEYLATVSWPSTGGPLLSVLSRDQRRLEVLAADALTGATHGLREATDPHWVDVVPGSPLRTADGRLVHTVDDPSCDTRRAAVDGVPLGPAGLQVAGILAADEAGVVVAASDEPTEQRLVRLGWDGTSTDLTPRGGWYAGVAAGGVLVVAGRTPATTTVRTTVRPGASDEIEVRSHAETPCVSPRATVLRAGRHGVVTAVLLPSDHAPRSRRLPVLMAPYGGPHAQEVVASGLDLAEFQWFADQGFAVVVADGRGTPSRGPAWEREVSGDLAGPVLEDQVSALQAALAAFPDDLDGTRVGIRGWSFGGFLAALAVLRRPDVFHAAVAGAPVTDWRRYDTAYTERYLGHPDEQPAAYDQSTLLDDAASLQRPLMLIHGLADDNVVVAHTLSLSGRLMAAGRAHTVLPLTGITHMTPQEEVAENLLLLQVDFLREHLGR